MRLSRSSCRGFLSGVSVALLEATVVTLPMISDLGGKLRGLNEKNSLLESNLEDTGRALLTLKLKQAEKTLPLLPDFSGEHARMFEAPESIVPKFELPPIVIPGEDKRASNLPFLPENFGSDESVDGFLWGLKEERRMNSLWFPKRNPWSDI